MNLSPENLTFLTDLADNNNREWFNSNKTLFQHYQDEFKAFHEHLKSLMDRHDQIARSKIFRIYRDVRFSKDKKPYKSHWSGTFGRATQYLRGGYYYQVEPGKSFAAGGFFGPNSQDLLHIRKQIQQDPDDLKKVLASKQFINYFGELQGEKVKTAPRGFSKDDPAIDLIRHKQFLVYHHFSDEQVTSKNFSEKLDNAFQAMRPFFDVMSEYLTTDLNGVSLIEGL